MTHSPKRPGGGKKIETTAMNEEKLYTALENLRTEIAKLSDNERDMREQLMRVVEDLERQLQAPDKLIAPIGTEEGTLTETLEKSIEQFEVDHPRVTEALNRIMSALSI